MPGIDRKFATGLVATLLSEGLGRGSALVFQFIVANQLGASRYGQVALALASAALLFPLADMGLQNLSLKLATRDGATETVPRLLSLKAFFAPAYLLPLAAWFFLTNDRGFALALLWAGCFYMLQSLGDMLRQVYRGQSKAKRELLARLGMPLGNIASLAAVWHWKPGPEGALLALCLGPGTLAAAYLWLLPQGTIRFAFGSREREIVVGNRGLLLQSVLYLAIVGMSTRIDAFVLQGYASTREVGRYFAVLNFVMAGGFLAQGFSSFLYPRLHRQILQRRRAFFRAAAIQGGLGLAMFAAVVAIGPFLFTHIFHSGSYAGAEGLLPGMGALLLCTTLDWLWLAVLLGKDRIWLTCVGLVPMLAAKAWLGPIWASRSGADGMLHAALAGSVATTLIGAVAAYRTFTAGDEASN
ncbi:MAG: Polysaccharide biosynthesis protein [Fibrobacterota bacterium]|jgi:O-antigen/teichoic acid export membrane protein